MSEDCSELCGIVGAVFFGILLAAHGDIAGLAPEQWQLKLALFALPVLTLALPGVWYFVPEKDDHPRIWLVRLLQAAGNPLALVAAIATTVGYLVLWPLSAGHAALAWVTGTLLFFVAGFIALEIFLPDEPAEDFLAPLREPIYGHSQRATPADLERAGHAVNLRGSRPAGYLEPPRESRS